MLFKEEQEAIKQMFFIEKDQVFITVSKLGGADLKLAQSIPNNSVQSTRQITKASSNILDATP